MPIEKLRPKYIFDEQRLEQLKHIAPECFADGKINWETLKEALGEYAEEETIDSEHFGLFWPGKTKARKLASTPSVKSLTPLNGEGLNEESTRNIFIEGENLEVLKLLQKSYAGRIKLIYIDPPYNTGNDFIYDDNFTETIEEFQKRTGLIDDEGRKLTTNSKADGRFHSKWLSMMYPRLRLARNLLNEEGFIFISIDDNEAHNLRALMDEIFGEENFRGTVVWQHSLQPKGYLGKFSLHHNYHICYSKTSEISLGSLNRTEEHNKNYSNPDKDPNGDWRSGDVRNALYRKNLIYDIVTPSGKKIKPPANGWRWSKETVKEKIKTGEIIFSSDETRIIRKIYLKNLEGRAPESIWFGKEVGTTRDGSNELKDLFNDKPPFDTPKPTGVIERMLEIVTSGTDDDIILDFFAGSGSTAHAVYNQNIKDSGNRKWILVQIPEEIDDSTPAGINAKKLGLKRISKVSAERIKRAAKSIKKENSKSILDLGFRFISIDKSNYKNWQNFKEADVKKLELEFENFESPLIENWKEEDLLTEVMLIEGFPLDSKIEKDTSHKKNNVQIVSSDFCEHRLLVSLDKKVYAETIKALQLNDNDVFICLDSAITDEQKVTLSDKGLIKTI